MRNALVVADKGGSASFIPYFEFFGTFPSAILLTWGLSKLMRMYSFRKIFIITMSFFLIFFVFFPFVIHPHQEAVQIFFEKTIGHYSFFVHWSDLLFYVMAELWKVALLSILFWGFINQHLSYVNAKRFYPPLMLGSSIGAILAGPITIFCTSENYWKIFSFSTERWLHSLISLTAILFIFGVLTLIAFNALYNLLSTTEIYSIDKEKIPFKRRLLSLSSSLHYILRSRYLLAILFIVIAEYVSYTLGELIFLETLKQKFPSPTDYCKYLGNLTMWTGLLTAFSAVFLTPYILQKYQWSYSAMLTPVLMVIMTCSFFTAIHFGKTGVFGTSSLSFVIFLGSLHFCIGRSAKYTIFDTTKELAFVPLSEEGQVKGKLVVDGIGSRFGRGTSSLISMTLFNFVGGPSESILFAGIIAITFALFMVPAARLVSREFETLNIT